LYINIGFYRDASRFLTRALLPVVVGLMVSTVQMVSADVLQGADDASMEKSSTSGTKDEFDSYVDDVFEQDPYESFNRSMFSLNERADKYVLRPVAKTYDTLMPGFLNNGITNFFNNIEDLETFVNSILQGKFDNTLTSLNRFIWNSTIGLAGFIDVATHFGLKVEEEDFGQTLGVWGYKNSAYLVLPFLGPGTVRDNLGRGADWYLSPTGRYLEVETIDSFALLGLQIVDFRADLLAAEGLIPPGDKYVFVRNAFLQNRDFVINDGQVDDAFADEAFDDFDDF